MKRLIFIVFLLLIIPFSLSLEDRLVIRLHTPSELVINLYDHLPVQQSYFINHTENVEVTVEEGTARITPIRQFKGSETIIFAVNESAVIEREELSEISKVVNITRLIEDYPKIISSAKTKEVFNETIDISPLLQNIEEKPIEKLYSKILEDHLFVIINDEIEINVSLKEDIPSYSIQLLSKQGSLDENALKLNVKRPILIILVIIVIIVLFFSIKKAAEGFRIQKPRHEKRLKWELSKSKKMPKATAAAHIMELIETFFRNKLDIDQSSSLVELNKRLHQEGIRGNTKQEMIFLFNKLREGSLSEHETELAKKYLKRALKSR